MHFIDSLFSLNAQVYFWTWFLLVNKGYKTMTHSGSCVREELVLVVMYGKGDNALFLIELMFSSQTSWRFFWASECAASFIAKVFVSVT